ncbi:RluA family pseudouridine synthase [Alicyclobacillus acidocaldarius]|uniref:RNA pseudouridylate synthase n=1 Tax=Alicyclobacillus acidocaldarius (strain Tc-4-1) TaxID=1048834 RepID=F8IFV5_ALIAT|nr:RluA family pseudouridine synthase [Alicyclobacillus acidocaldarius]AEJ42926.1 pseudouridine synthase [Alicyclobacillus acidocaldarius subsp. acidocaldarius Tc-4-1]
MDVRVNPGGISISLPKPPRPMPWVEALSQALHVPQSHVRHLLRQGAVRVRGSAPGHLEMWDRPTQVWIDEKLHPVDVAPATLPPVQVFYNDSSLLVVDKPANLLVHSDGSGAPTLDACVQRFLNEEGAGRAYHVHRLDRGTTGCVLYAKHGLMLRAMDAELAAGRVRRTYLAVACGARIRPGVVSAPIGRDRHVSGRYRVSRTGKAAHTHVDVLDEAIQGGVRWTLVRLRLETGRRHQIRVHLSAMGAPVVGDTLYGGAPHPALPPGQLALHAARLQFCHPYTGEDVEVHAPLPPAWEALVAAVGLSLDCLKRE